MVEETPDQKAPRYALLAKDTALGLANADALRELRLEAEGSPQTSREIYALADELGLVKECHGYLGRSTYVTPNLSLKGSGDRKGFGSGKVFKGKVPFGGIWWDEDSRAEYEVGFSRIANRISLGTTGTRICSEVEEWGYAGMGPILDTDNEPTLCNLMVYSRSDGQRKAESQGEDGRAIIRLLRGALLNRIFGWDTLSTRNVCMHEGERGKEALMVDLETLGLIMPGWEFPTTTPGYMGWYDAQGKMGGHTLSAFVKGVQPGALSCLEKPQALEDLLGLELSPAASPEGYTADQRALITSGGEIPLDEVLFEALHIQAEQLAAYRMEIADTLRSVAERADWMNHRERMPTTLEGMLALVQKVKARRGESTDIVLDHTTHPDSPYAEALRSLPVRDSALKRETNAADILWAFHADPSLHNLSGRITELREIWDGKRFSPLYAHLQYSLAAVAYRRQEKGKEARLIMGKVFPPEEETESTRAAALSAWVEGQIADVMNGLPGAEGEKRLTFEFPERHLTLDITPGEIRATASRYLNAPQRAVRSLKRRIVKKRAPKRYVAESVEELDLTSLNRCAYGAMVACEALKAGLIGMPPGGKFVLRG